MALDNHDFVVLGDKDLVDFNADGVLPQSAEDIGQIRLWLDPTDYASDSSEFNKHQTSYTPGTGKWIREAVQYQNWLQYSVSSTLWIKGVAGSGKSVVAAQIATLLEQTKAPVLYFFFRQIIAANKTPQSLLRDWLAQLLEYSPALQLKLKSLLDQNRSLDSVALNDLWELVDGTLSDLPRAYCIVDALDEMDPGHDSFTGRLAQLGRKRSSIVKVLITSRPLPYIGSILSEPSVIQLVLKSQLVDIDIATYLETRLGSTELPDESKAEIQKVLGGNCQGLFLYARLMLDQVLQSSTPDIQSTKTALGKLPSGLGDMYTRMLDEHSIRSGTPQDLQLLILQCVMHSSRPLRLLELSTVADFVRRIAQYPIFTPPMGLSKDTKSIIRNGCGPLLEILEDETVSIIHHSLTEFLTDGDRNDVDPAVFPIIHEDNTHLTMARLCINYLLMDWLPDWEENTDGMKGATQNARLNHPFLDYAIKNWCYHTSKYGQIDAELFEALDKLMDPESSTFSLCLNFIDDEANNARSAKGLTPLHVSATDGLAAYAKHLIDTGHDIDALDKSSRTPLHRAAEKGHADVVECLLKHGAANNLDDITGLTPLHLAASANHTAVVKLLLAAGVDSLTPKTKENPGNWCGNAPRTEGSTAVMYACEYGHSEVVAEFLPYLDGDGLSKALCWAASHSRTKTALVILKTSRVDMNKPVNDKTPLHRAAESQDLVTMQKLLDLGADVSIKSQKRPPLHAFVQSCQGGLRNSLSATLDMIKLLIFVGCDVNEYCDSGMTVFQICIGGTYPGVYWTINCYPAMIELLLDHGADVSLCSKDGSSVLHLVPPSSKAVVELLVTRGSDVNARRRSDGRTPLFNAVTGSSEPSMLALIKYGAKCDVQDDEGTSLMHVLLGDHSSSPSKLKALLDNGANPNARNRKGETPLHVIRSWTTQEELISCLLARGADLEAKTTDGLTVLLQAVKNVADLESIKSLVKAGARLDARDFDGRTVLHYCCEENRRVRLFNGLVESGADPSTRDFAGNTLFHQMARQQSAYLDKEQLDQLKMLLKLGVSPLSPNNAGQTPFYVAAGMNRDRPWGRRKTDPFEFLLGPDCNADVNMADNKGIRPIHLAASLSEYQVTELLDRGADPLVLTVEGFSVLHISARTRCSNTVGMMVKLFQKLGRADMMDLKDTEGKTALHYAVRSGRAESVAALLSAGASITIKDSAGMLPLDMCRQFLEEDFHWSIRTTTVGRPSYIDAAYVTLNDPYRPRGYDNGNWSSRLDLGSAIGSEHHTVGVRQIARLLVAHGADVSSIVSGNARHSYRGRGTIYEAALNTDCEVLAGELLQISTAQSVKRSSDTAYARAETHDEEDFHMRHKPWNNFVEKYVASRSENSFELLKGNVIPGGSNLSTFNCLLRTENSRGIEEFARLGADLLKPQWDGVSCITTLVKWGYSSALEKVGAGAALMTESWIEETEKTDSNLPGRLRHPLHIACERTMPNLEVIKILVGKFGVDVNSRSKKDGTTALHVLATGNYWWQLQALEYLLKQGADPETRNTSGASVLHTAIGAQNGSRKEAVAEILLRHGANANALDGSGLSCLNKAGSNTALMRKLIEHGADVSAGNRPLLFDAIQVLDLETVKILVEMKADLNVKLTPEEDDDDDDLYYSPLEVQRGVYASPNGPLVPIHYAANREFNTEETKDRMIPIIQELLGGGADPFLPYDESGDSILHDILENEGIAEPFVELENLNLEARDSKGKTYLLSACSTSAKRSSLLIDEEWASSQPSPAQLLLARRADLSAVDNEGNNAFHHLLRTNSENERMRTHQREDFADFLAHSSGPAVAAQKNLHGTTPLHLALQDAQLWAVELLLASGSNALERDSNGNTALHHLARIVGDYHENYDGPDPLAATLFETFLSLGVDINTPNKLGETPIFTLLASSSCGMEELQLFESKGADLMVRDRKGRGLLHVLAQIKNVTSKTRGGHESMEIKMFRYLMGKGLDPMMEDGEQRTSLDVAAASGSTGFVEIFKREG